MSAEMLREAAALLRDRAEAANEGPWSAKPHPMRRDAVTVQAPFDVYVAHYLAEEDATYIATMHPAVGLALADWLEVVAARFEDILSNFATGSLAGHVTAVENTLGYQQALSVAAAILGRTS